MGAANGCGCKTIVTFHPQPHMPAKQKEAIWTAEPHTIAKVEVLRAYLIAYFQILGSSKPGQHLLYIDGFAGPDQYRNFSHGSPSAALNAATEALRNSGGRWSARELHCAFVEPDRKRFDNLIRKVEPFRTISGLRIHTYNTVFINGLAELRKEVPTPFTKAHPLFVFIDPFGATGAPFRSIKEILTSNCSEVLINLDADGIGRIFRAKDRANYEALLTEIYGDHSWEAELNDNQPFSDLCRRALHLYTRKLRELSGVRYVFAFEMQSSTGTLNYSLVFASKHPLGLTKMKEAMRRIDQDGSYRFADAEVSQPSLFRFDDPDEYALGLHKHFEGRRVSYEGLDNELTTYALNRTPLLNPKAMLAVLEERKLIRVITGEAKRRRGTFKEGSVKAIEFVVNDGLQF
jgi:three-Cys-motif partner protein